MTIKWDADPSKRKAFSSTIAAWAKTSEGAGKINVIAALAKSFPEIAIEPEQLDQDRMATNVRNGTLRLVRDKQKRSTAEIEAGKSEWHTTGWKVRIDKHDRANLITKLAQVDYRASAKAPEYDAFLDQVQPDPTMRRFIHQWGGLSLTGDVSEQKLAFFYGEGRNGKGTWVETIAALAGDYAGSIPIESFLDSGGKRRGDQATPDIARLPGVRFLRVSEPGRGASLNEGLIKMVTGGDPVDARHLNKGFFTFLPAFKMTISGMPDREARFMAGGRGCGMSGWPEIVRERAAGDYADGDARPRAGLTRKEVALVERMLTEEGALALVIPTQHRRLVGRVAVAKLDGRGEGFRWERIWREERRWALTSGDVVGYARMTTESLRKRYSRAVGSIAVAMERGA